MPDDNLLPLQRANPLVDVSFCDLQTPTDILDFVVENMMLNATALKNSISSQIVFSPTEPTGADIGKIWIKTSGDPRGIGLYINGAYVIIPIPADAEEDSDVPPGLIAMWNKVDIPEGWTVYSPSGMPELPDGVQYIQKGG